MKIGVIYYSLTGTTEEFARRIENVLIKNGYNVKSVKIITDVEVTGPGQKFELKMDTDCSEFDVILFGGPVWAFSACPVVIEYIKTSKGLAGKKVIPFVTMGFPFSFMGGNRAINQIKKIAKDMKADIQPGVVMPKLFHKISKVMDEGALKILSTIRGIDA